MFRLAGFVVAVSFAVSTFAATTKNTIVEMSAVGEVQIAPDGSVSDYRLQSKLTPAIAELVDRGVRAWHFQPVLVDGKPVVAKTAMRLTLKGVPVDDANYRIEVANVIFGEPHMAENLKRPKYPPTAISSHVGAKVLLYLKIDDEGNVVEAEPYQTSLDVRTQYEVDAQALRKLFETASLSAARNWHFDITETVNGKKLGGIVMVPFVFSLHNASGHDVQDGQWKAYVPGPIHDVPLGREAKITNSSAFADLGEGQAQALNSRFKLRDDVIGKPL